MTTPASAKRTDAVRNRERILRAAREAFADDRADVSMAEIVRRSGVGSATLYRNFATRRDLLEALYVDEVDAVCAAASTIQGDSTADRLVAWLHRFFGYVTSKRHVATELLTHTEREDAVFTASRDRVLAAGAPLFSAALDAGDIRTAMDLGQILDLVVAIAKIPGEPAYLEPILDTALVGLRSSPSGVPGNPLASPRRVPAS
jgi:AcrR family transcriptional regulator